MIKLLLRTAMVSTVCISLSGCLTTMYLVKRMNMKEYTPVQISGMSNFGLVSCTHDKNVKSSSQDACTNEIQTRITSKKMTEEEYSRYDSQTVSTQPDPTVAYGQALQGMATQMQQQNQANEAARAELLKSSQPVEVNVHHTY